MLPDSPERGPQAAGYAARATRRPPMKKLLLLVIIVAIGATLARKVRA
jgi:hypothetical protein